MSFKTPFKRFSRVRYLPKGETRTKQYFKDECDVNAILARYEKDGVIEHCSRYSGNYADFTDALSYEEALNKVIEANDMFASLPAKIRSRFSNDPAQFLDFCTDSKNHEEMKKMGLLSSSRDSEADRGSSQELSKNANSETQNSASSAVEES